MPESIVVGLMRAFKRDIVQAGSAQQAEMAQRWLATERRLAGQMEALAYRMDAAVRAGGTVTPTMLMNDVRYRELLIQLTEEQAKYTVYAERTITDGQKALASAGVTQSQAAIAAQVSTSFNRLPVNAVEHMVGLAGNGGPLHTLLVESWPLSAQGLTQALVDGVALGWGPRKTAKMMAEGMTGSLDRMMTIARTEQLRSYRQASYASYAESGIVIGYRRLATHDRRSCISCILDEGTFYALGEEMPLHPNDRCVPIPVVRGPGGTPLPIEWKHGEDWFMDQPSETQESILGKGHYEAWRLGQYDLQDLVKVTPNATWGDSLGVTPLKELGGQAARGGSPLGAVSAGKSTVLMTGQEKIFAAERRIFRQDYESAFAVLNDGTVVLEKDGQATSVSFDAAEMMQIRGSKFTHNHPTGWKFPASDLRRAGNSFSAADIEVAATAELTEMRAVTPKYVHVMRPPSRGWTENTWKNTIEPAYNKANTEVRMEYWNQIRSGIMTPEQAEAQHVHEVWTRVSKDTGLDYSRYEHDYND